MGMTVGVFLAAHGWVGALRLGGVTDCRLRLAVTAGRPNA